MPNKAVFFDRDGTLMEEVEYCADPALVRVYPGIPAALEKLKQAGYLAIVITNQSGIGRGYFTENQYRAVEREFLRQIGEELIDASYYCADVPDVPSMRRKPGPGMVLEAAADFDIDLGQSYFIGDKRSDIECGKRAGTLTILVLTGYGKDQNGDQDSVADDAVAAINLVLRRPQS